MNVGQYNTSNKQVNNKYQLCLVTALANAASISKKLVHLVKRVIL